MHHHQRTELILLSHIQTISLSDGFFTDSRLAGRSVWKPLIYMHSPVTFTA